VDQSSIAMLQFTSGSTASPRGVVVTHANLMHNLKVIATGFRHDEHSQGVIWLPPYHDMGLIGGILEPMNTGFPVTLMSPLAFLQHPQRWISAVSRYRATTSGGPNFAYELCTRKVDPATIPGLDLSSWTVAFNGSEPVRPDTLDRFVEKFGPYGFRHEAFYPCYGLAEATLMVTGGEVDLPPRGLAMPDSQKLISCGRTFFDHRLKVVDPITRVECNEREVGELWISGPSVARGYWQDAEETENVFGGRIAGSPSEDGPYLRSGDLGFVHEGELYVAGRKKDLIIIRGRNYHPHDIERSAEQSCPALRPGCTAAFSIDAGSEEQLIVVSELRAAERLEEVRAAIRAAITRDHSLRTKEIVLVQPGTIPKTSSGKIQRLATRQAYLDGKLSVVDPSN
jgi:acyl-CoA synthetase (AMP-forming)/AMP-acid ligase II